MKGFLLEVWVGELVNPMKGFLFAVWVGQFFHTHCAVQMNELFFV
jgi:hypothetical protein